MFTIELVVSSVLVFLKAIFEREREREITEKQTSSFTDSGEKNYALILNHLALQKSSGFHFIVLNYTEKC